MPPTTGGPGERIPLSALHLCFEGAIPAVVATASADGCPNVTYLSRVRQVDTDHVALSNQFLSKTNRNLAENPRASLLVLDPTTYDEYRLTLAYERTERRGQLFELLSGDVDAVAAESGLQDVFRLRSADIYRVVDVEQLPSALGGPDRREDETPGPAGLAELTARLSRCGDLDTLVSVTVDGLAELLGFEHTLLLLLDESGKSLFTIASHGYPAEGVGSEVRVGEGTIGMAAARGVPMRVGNLRQIQRYSKIVRQGYEDSGEIGPGREIPVPGLPDVTSRVAVPGLAMGQLVGVLVAESSQAVAFTADDESTLSAVATLVANAVEVARAQGANGPARRSMRGAIQRDTDPPTDSGPAATWSGPPRTRVRFFPVDGSTFLDDEYLIKGVAGRILWALLGHHEREGREEFTNKEVRLDPSLELPEFRDNLESRLILLKRRLDEREAPIRIEKTGRGRFRLRVEARLTLEAVGQEQG